MGQRVFKWSDVRKWNRAWVAETISNLTSPPLVAWPTYVIAGLYDQARHDFSPNRLFFALFMAIFLTVIFPIAYILFLRSRHRVSTIMIPIRQERTLPYLVIIVAFLLAFGTVYWVIGPGVLAGMLLISATNGLIVLIINLYWKISAHAIGVGIPLATLTVLFGWVVWPFYLTIPVVNWARVYIQAHTLGQVIAGTAFGLALTLAQYLLILRPLGWL